MTAITSTDIIPAKSSRRRRYSLVAVALLLPMALINLIAFIAPVAHLAQISFLQSESGGVLTDRYTFENYINFFTDSFNWGLVFNSLWLSAFITLATLICAYPIALFLHRVSPVWRNFLFVVTVSPLLVSSVVRTYGWMVLLGDQGLVNGALMNLGIISSPIRLVNNTLGVFIGMVEILIPYMALSLIAGFGRLNASLEEAAASSAPMPSRGFAGSSCHSPCRASHLAACFASCWQSAPSSHRNCLVAGAYSCWRRKSTIRL